MSTLKATTLSNLAGSQTVPMDTVAQGSAKAWVNFNGTGTVAIRRAFNVSSITDLGVGVYQVNFTNAMSDSNYSSIVVPDDWSASTNNQTTNSVRASCFTSSSGASRDDTGVKVAIFS